MTMQEFDAKLNALRVEDVVSVYSGKAGKCCCGCSGNHYYSSIHVEKASKRRGYVVTADEINDKQVERVFNIVRQAAEFNERLLASNIVSCEVDGQLYVAYLA